MILLRKIALFILFISSCHWALSQNSELEEIVREGIAFHDLGEYNKAIECYFNALEIDSTSSLANYEIAYSMLASGNYHMAVEYSNKVIAKGEDHLMASFICLGNALDMLGKPEHAISTYERAIESFDHYLIHYNLALTCYNLGDQEKAYSSVLDAICNNPAHGSSHLVLSKIMESKGSRVRAMLPLYFFLLIEPNSERAAIEYDRLVGFIEQGVSQTSETDIQINISEDIDPDFGAAEFAISSSRALHFSQENKDKSNLELFAETNKSVFSVLGELKKDNTGFFWDFYVPFFYELIKKKHGKAYSYYISMSLGDEATLWMDSNEKKMNKFFDWVNN